MSIKTWEQMAWEDGCDPEMRPDPRHYTDEMQAEIAALRKSLERAERALQRGGFQDLGGQEWKPPIGKPPRFIEVESPEAAQDALDAARYRKLRQHFKNHEACLELWGITFNGNHGVSGEDDLDEFCDRSIAAEKEQAK